MTCLIAELSTHVAEQLADGFVWRCWQAMDQRLASFPDLSAVLQAWEGHAGVPVRQALGALTGLGSVRGSDDQLAAMAALVLMGGGVRSTARDLADVCEPEDVVVAMWLEIRRAEPSPGPSVGRHLVRRTRQRLLREHRPERERALRLVRLDAADSASLEQCEADDSGPETSAAEFVDLLAWAEQQGLLASEAVGLLIELVAEQRAGATATEAVCRVGVRRGLAERTVRRRRQLAIEVLRRAVPDYLAATA
ncbi:hypothetical protein [Nocardioides marmotae]|uniref:Uncharacterized protein n=1 Tax=Nocardioides marmotae TaxID=2663857 RepID=A0A6I3IZY9_9ACTN|nr:hypothetical protein [Nocardioides marmotae]MCR6030685.1 hypothetical protein [Gordonia jinghuaiqii]MBC9735546.1 hypothetical protein [Nocardioides marmotae]MTB86643.1 hypothetical protein [Nocardioides marmotae]MTB94321.1 hypothetical protein [Nocardioides marmotae]QKE01649.1 hypothetical protein HPC71_11590 [Nocardioides marmotae]